MEHLKKIRKIRQIKKKKTQQDIADVLQTTQQQYAKYELGKQEIPLRHIVTLCRYYNVSADWLLGLKEE